MPAYIISDVTVKDRESYEAYRTRAAPSITQYGGRYLARGGAIESLEGNWTPHVIVIVEFPDLESARTWYSSPEYAATFSFRDAGLRRNLILVDGLPQPL
jgi:uncharacterized protein (DUF1330 family)